jgi:hypothetical protein
MAEDWIKMRTDLYRDPKVCVIADMLMHQDSDLARYVNQHCQRDMTVTRNVMRNVTVGALVSVWGVMRMRGKREGDDLVCRATSVAVIDDIADIPGFGSAMESVGWVELTDEYLVFPHFFEDYNVDPEGDSKERAAARQRRYRERIKGDGDGGSDGGSVTGAVTSDVTESVTSDVTVTSQSNAREEKRRDKKHTASSRFDPQGHLEAMGVEPKIASDWLALRKVKKLAPTETAFAGVLKQAEKAGISMNDAVHTCCVRGWGGFEAAWLTNRPASHANGSSVAAEYGDLLRGAI